MPEPVRRVEGSGRGIDGHFTDGPVGCARQAAEQRDEPADEQFGSAAGEAGSIEHERAGVAVGTRGERELQIELRCVVEDFAGLDGELSQLIGSMPKSCNANATCGAPLCRSDSNCSYGTAT